MQLHKKAWIGLLVAFLPWIPGKLSAQDFFTQNFNASAPGNAFPAGWTAINDGAATSAWVVQNPFTYQGSNLNFLGSNYAFSNGDPGGSGSITDVTLTSPSFNTASTSLLFLEFDQFYRDYSATPTDSAIVEVFNGTAWVKIQSKDVSTSNNGTGSEKVTFNVTAYKNAGMRIRFRYVGEWPWFWGIDNIRVFQPAAADIGVTAVLSPVGDCGLGANTQVKVRISNFGSAAQSNFPVKYQVNNNPVVTGTFSGTIQPGAAAEYIFPTTANLSGPNDYFTSAWTELSGDPAAGNDSTRNVKSKKAGAGFTAANFQGFNGTNLSTLHEGWKELSTSNLPSPIESAWRQSTDAQQVAFGTVTATINLYTNTRREWMISPSFVVAPSAGLTFKMAVTDWQFSGPDAMGEDDSLKILVSNNCGATWNFLTFFGKNSGLTKNLTEKIVPLTAYEGQEVRLAFYATDGPVDNQEDYDLHLDDINVRILPDKDIGVNTISAPLSGCGVANAAVRVNLVNTGTAAQTNFPLCYTINGGAPVCQNFTSTLNPGQSANFTFNPSTVLSTPGDYVIQVYSGLASDGNTANDTVKGFSFQNLPLINTFPYFESFETTNGGWIADGTFSSWALGTPAKSIIQGAGHGSRAYVTGGLGAENANSDEKSTVVSPCISFANLPNPMIEMRVWWHSEAGVDGAVLQSSEDGGATWKVVGRVGDNYNWYNTQPVTSYGTLVTTTERFGWSGGLNDNTGSGRWITVRNRLKGLGGKSNLRLRVVYGGNNANHGNGFAFDAVRIYEQPDNDMAILSITRPNPIGCGLSDTTRIGIRAVNLGKSPVTGLSLGYKVIGGTPVVATVSGLNLATDSILNYTFATTQDFTAEATYFLEAWTGQTGDAFRPNDTLRNFSFRRKINLTDTLKFDGFNGLNLNSLSSEWTVGVGSGRPGTASVSGWKASTANQGISMKSTTSRTNMFSINKNDWMYSRGFKVPENGYLFFKAAVTNTNDTTADLMGSDDRLRVMVSTDCGLNWSNVYSITRDSNLTRKLRQFRVNLASFVGQEIRVGLYATSGPVNDPQDYDLHVDDVYLQVVAPSDAGISAILSPVISCGLTGASTVQVRITNFGSQPAANIPVFYRVNVDNPIGEVFAGPIAGGASATYTFSTPANLSVSQPYQIKAWARLGTDQVFVNDSSRINLVKVIAPFAPLSFAGFNGSNLDKVYPGWSEAKNINPVAQDAAWTNGSIAGQPTAKILLAGGSKIDWMISPGIRIGAAAFLNFRAGLFSVNGTGSAEFDVDDSVTVMISQNCGQNWVKLFKLGKLTQPALSATMQLYSISLAAYANKEIRIAFRARDGVRTDFTSDLHLGSVEISSTLAQDVGAISILFPPTIMEQNGTYEVGVRVSNFGTAELGNFPVTLNLSGGYTDTRNVPLLTPGQTLSISFNPFTPVTGGSFIARAFTGASVDQNIGNDTVYQTYAVVGLRDRLRVPELIHYPNPASSELNLLFAEEPAADLIFTLVGFDGRQIPITTGIQKDGKRVTLQLPELPAGLYVIQGSGKKDAFARTFRIE